jgi:competence transcription factor ComK
MSAHVSSVHYKKCQVKCRFCPEKFAIGADMNAHVTSAHAIQCKFCPAKFLTKKDMDLHESTTGHKILDLNKPVPTTHDKSKFCQEFVKSCPENFAIGAVMNAHVKSVHAIKCSFCPEKFVKNQEMSAHVSSVHNKKCQVKCRFCPEKFAIGADMNAHVTSAHAIQCKFCPAKFLTKKDMDLHESTTGHKILDLNKPVPTTHDKSKFCQEFVKSCPENFAIGAVMNAHVKSVHAIKCPFCPASFLKNKDLDQHSKIHDGKSEIKIMCHLCDKCVKSTAIDEHMASVHGKIRIRKA